MNRFIFFLPFYTFFTLLFLSCGTVGKVFDITLVSQVETGKTAKKDVEDLFGKPFRTGFENGREVWIYEYSTYSAFTKESSKDLILVFDKEGRVYSQQVMARTP